MQRSDLSNYYAENVGLIHTVTKKGHAKLMAMGASYDYNDLFQDLSVVFIRAFDAFDESKGLKFSTYFTVAANNKVGEFTEAAAIERIELGMRSVEEMASWKGEGEGPDEAELVPSEYVTAEEELIGKQTLAGIMGKLSPLASLIMEMTVDPPTFIEREFAARATHAKIARDQGTERRAPGMINVSFVCSVLGRAKLVPKAALTEARHEIARVAEETV